MKEHLRKTAEDPNSNVDLCYTNHETGRDRYVKTGPHLQLHAEAMEMVAKGHDAWCRPSR